MSKITWRAIFLSDVHLGAKDAQVEYLFDFLRYNESEYLYLVGDILDLWKLRSGWYWPQLNNQLVQLVLEKARKGTKVVYIPGNHDELLRDYAGMNFNGIEIATQAVHVTADDRRFLLLHGDEFDSVVMSKKWLAHLGSWAYDALLLANRYFNYGRRKLGFPYWSLSAYLKHRVKNAVSYISSFEEAVSREAERQGVDGLICGHIHKAEIGVINGVAYVNTGDWVESCTVVTEDQNGEFRIVRWVEESVVYLGDGATELPVGNTVPAVSR